MENVKGIYKNVNLEQILDKLNNIQNNEYTEIKVELRKNIGEHYIFEENNELTIILSTANLSNKDKEICTEIAELIKEYNKDKDDKKIEEISNGYINESVEEIVDKNSKSDIQEHNIQLERVQRKIDECKQKGEYITTKITHNDTYYGIDIDGTYIDINGTTLSIDKIIDSDKFKDIIREILQYNETIPLESDMQDEKVSDKLKSFKDSLKYNIDKKVEDNKPKVKRVLRNVATTLETGCSYVVNAYNSINKQTRRRALAIFLAAVSLYSAGSIGYNIGRANEYLNQNGYGTENTSVQDAIKDLKEQQKAEIELKLGKELNGDIDITARPSTEDDLQSYDIRVENDGKYYSIPKELEGMLENIAKTSLFQKNHLCRLIDQKNEIEEYFENHTFKIEDSKFSKKDKIVAVEDEVKSEQDDSELEH